MNAKLQPFSDALTAVSPLLDQEDQNILDLNSKIQTLTSQKQADDDLIASLKTADAAQVLALQQQLAAAPLAAMRNMMVLSGLHKLPFKTTDAIEVPNTWIDSGGHTAQSNPSTSKIPHGTFNGTPGTDTAPARVNFNPGAGWDDLYLYQKKDMPPQLPKYVIDIRAFSMLPADRAVVNCNEFQQQFSWKGKTYNCAWQVNYPAKLFRYFDHNAQQWRPSEVPFVDIGQAPVILMSEFILDPVAGTTTHVALSINGVRTEVGVTQPATPTPNAADKYTISLCQLDALGKGLPFGLNIHNREARLGW
jgi:hypothetical protein